MKEINFCNIDGIKLGHAEDINGITGCTTIICEEGATGGVDVRGGAPGTRETDLLDPCNMVEKINAVVLSGGSAFGLSASTGVMKYLEEKNIGFDTGVCPVPIVCSAVIFDLDIGDKNSRPNESLGYLCALNSENYTENINGNIGAGLGATVGKILGPNHSMKGGLGSYAVNLNGLEVGAVVIVNSMGDIICPDTGKIIAGALRDDNTFLNTEDYIIKSMNFQNVFKGNTTIGCIATNAILTKAEAKKISSIAHNGFARCIFPCHTMFDGDTIFTMATNKVLCDINLIGVLARHCMEKAIVKAITHSRSIKGIPSYNDILNK